MPEFLEDYEYTFNMHTGAAFIDANPYKWIWLHHDVLGLIEVERSEFVDKLRLCASKKQRNHYEIKLKRTGMLVICRIFEKRC